MKKTDVNKYVDNDIRNVYNESVSNNILKKEFGLTRKIIENISKEKDEPDWVLDIRIKALEQFYKMDNPDWGPDISYLNIDDIATYVKPVDGEVRKWDDVPDDIKDVFDKLGIPDAEKESLAGSGAQFDSEIVYHNLTDDLKKQGVIYTSFDEGIRQYPELVKKYFKKAVPIYDHKYIALHYALFSGGSFVEKNAYLRFSTIENWSKNMLNLNTKKCYVSEGGKIEWIMGSFGSRVSMLYPLSVLNGVGAKCEFLNISFAGKGQNLDTGIKVIHNAPKTSTIVNAKSISKDGGVCTFRSNVNVKKKAIQSKLSLSCESLMLDSISRSDTIPVNTLETDDVTFSHEAKIGKISDKSIYYLMTRGLSEDDAKGLIVRGFAEPIAKAFPVEYAVEMNRLIDLELEGTIG